MIQKLGGVRSLSYIRMCFQGPRLKGYNCSMCGRFSQSQKVPEFLSRFNADLAEQIEDRRLYNIPPSSKVLVVYQDEKGQRKLRQMIWDLRKSWTKEKEEGAKSPATKDKDKKPKKGPLSNLT